MARMVLIYGFMVDIRKAPLELQEEIFRLGLQRNL